MFRALNCLGGEHDLRLVVLAGLICFIASVVAISLFHRAMATVGRVRTAWLTLAGVATAMRSSWAGRQSRRGKSGTFRATHP
jgi:NO-binding membrane sensor protein with MHYT domain